MALNWPEQDRAFRRPQFFMEAMAAVIGQEDLKRKLAASFSYYTRFLEDESVDRPVVLVYGPSGAGKTYSIEKCCQAAGLPFTVISGASVSAAGYKGVTLRDLLVGHWMRFEQSEGVIFVDEIDKWCQAQIKVKESEMLAMGLSKQGECLRYVEHEDINFLDESRDFEELKGTVFQTRKTMWVFAGAFPSLDQLIARRLGQEGTYWDPEDIWEKASNRDFTAYGLMEEFSNRITTWAYVRPLTRAQLYEVLEAQETPRWRSMFENLGCELTLDASALAYCANIAFEHKTGARGAAQLLHRVMEDVYAEVDRHEQTRVFVDGHVIQTGSLYLEGEGVSGNG